MTANPHALDDAQIAQFIREGLCPDRQCLSPRPGGGGARHHVARPAVQGGRPVDLDAAGDPVAGLWRSSVPGRHQYGRPASRHSTRSSDLGRWRPRRDIGTFPVRFPHPDDPGDAGWHVDLSFPGADCDPNETRDFSAWRVNITSRGRALLLLFLFSDVGEDDAPTRIRVGSHIPMARYLAPAGEAGRARMVLDEMGADCPIALATGSCRDSLSLPSLPGSCRTEAPGNAAAFHGAAVASSR